MSDLLEKIGIFDFFSMLVPGAISIISFMLIIPDGQKYYNDYVSGKIDFVLFLLIGGYLTGVVLHEIMTLFDEKLFYVIKKRPRENFSKTDRVFKNPIDREMAQKVVGEVCQNYSYVDQNDTVKKGIVHEIKRCLNRKLKAEKRDSRDKFTYSVCVNVLEACGKCSKSDKMHTNAEMSKALMISYIFILAAYISPFFGREGFSVKRILFLVFLIAIFYIRARRYDIYRVRSVIRTYDSLKNERVQSKENENKG